MNIADRYYKQNLSEILFAGNLDENPRPKWADGAPAHSQFITAVTEKYNIHEGQFPIPTLRNTAIKTGIKEILWIYQKQSNCLDEARAMGINWWDSWDIGNNTIGHRYGHTIKKYDLMNKLLVGLEKDPFGRRHIIDMYQYESLEETAGLNPCAFMTIWSVRRAGKSDMFLDMTLIQRSNDYIVAGYINKIQYVALMMMVGGHLGYIPGEFTHFTQNLHIYDRHMPVAEKLIAQKPLNVNPFMRLPEQKNFYNYTVDDFEIFNTKDIPKLEERLEVAI